MITNTDKIWVPIVIHIRKLQFRVTSIHRGREKTCGFLNKGYGSQKWLMFCLFDTNAVRK